MILSASSPTGLDSLGKLTARQILTAIVFVLKDAGATAFPPKKTQITRGSRESLVKTLGPIPVRQILDIELKALQGSVLVAGMHCPRLCEVTGC